MCFFLGWAIRLGFKQYDMVLIVNSDIVFTFFTLSISSFISKFLDLLDIPNPFKINYQNKYMFLNSESKSEEKKQLTIKDIKDKFTASFMNSDNNNNNNYSNNNNNNNQNPNSDSLQTHPQTNDSLAKKDLTKKLTQIKKELAETCGPYNKALREMEQYEKNNVGAEVDNNPVYKRLTEAYYEKGGKLEALFEEQNRLVSEIQRIDPTFRTKTIKIGPERSKGYEP